MLADPRPRVFMPPRLNPDRARLESRLARRRLLEVPGLRLRTGAGGATDGERFGLLVNGAAGLVTVPRAMVGAVLRALDPAADAAAPDVRCLLLELALEGLLGPLDALGLTMALSPDAPVPDDPLALFVAVRLGGAAEGGLDATLRVDLSEAAAGHVADALDGAPPQRDRMGWLPTPLRHRVAACDLTVAALRAMRAGDVIVADAQKLLIAGERFAWRIRPDAAAVTVISARLALADDFRETGMDTTDDAAATLDDLPVRLVFELGRIGISLGELETLGPGHVFDLGRDTARPVDIIANGRRIGSGELVTIGETIGVRVLSLGPTG